jgi:hyperosmotically inducible periplasmic protein
MKNTNRVKKGLAVGALLLSLAACAAVSGRETAGEYVDDATITSTIKVEILKEKSLKVLQINVETMQGDVQLSGFVDSAKSEQKAVALAKRVRGVKHVQDNLIIRKK